MKNFLSQFRFLQYIDTDKNKWYPHIRHDWVVLFLFGVIFVTFFFILHSYLYLQINKEDFFFQTSDIKKTANDINSKEIASILSAFTEKKEQFNAIVQKSETLIDPAIGVVSPLETKNKASKGTNLLIPQ